MNKTHRLIGEIFDILEERNFNFHKKLFTILRCHYSYLDSWFDYKYVNELAIIKRVNSNYDLIDEHLLEVELKKYIELLTLEAPDEEHILNCKIIKLIIGKIDET